jgi:MoaA/NifB/PqqE/SkfB family radical SAM enzyme
MELRKEHLFVPCCKDWLKEEYFQLKTGSDPWRGPAAKSLRRSILDGSYKYCKTEICHFKGLDAEDLRVPREGLNKDFITPKNREALLQGKSSMPEGPGHFAVLNDSRCNLACASCRTSHILIENEDHLKKAEKFLKKHRESVEVLKLAGDGEVFFSPWLKALVKSITPELYPRFSHIDLLSNGLLFNEASYQALMPGARFIKKICISVDAGDEKTYREVRGGSWAKLIKNLRWIGEQKRLGTFEYFQMHFTVQRRNFKSIPGFVALAKEVGASEVKLAPLLPFSRMALNLKEHAVHEPSHPQHEELKRIREDLRHDPFVRWTLPESANIKETP